MIKRNSSPKFEKIPLKRRLKRLNQAFEEISEDLEIRRDNLLAISKDMISLSRWLTWEVQKPSTERKSATCLSYASKMYAAFLKL